MPSALQLSSKRKYQFMEVNTTRRSAGLKDKIPDIQQTLDMVRFLKTREVRIYLFGCDFVEVKMLTTEYAA